MADLTETMADGPLIDEPPSDVAPTERPSIDGPPNESLSDIESTTSELTRRVRVEFGHNPSGDTEKDTTGGEPQRKSRKKRPRTTIQVRNISYK